MASYSSKLDVFWKKMSDCPYELPDEMKPFIESALKAAGFDQVVTTTSSSSPTPSTASTGSTVKKLNGYNLFMREKSVELKSQNVPSGERMSKVAALWKLVPDATKAEYKQRAANITSTAIAASPLSSPLPKAPKKGSGQLTGYQLYMKEKMAELKTQDVPGGQRMGKVATMWKALTDSDKKEWSNKAKGTTTTTPPTVPAVVPPLPAATTKP
jgi:hypothetical protein